VRSEKLRNEVIKLIVLIQAGCFTPVIPVLGRLRQEDHEFEARLDYIERSVSKKRKKIT
jgi:hypothetical protein